MFSGLFVLKAGWVLTNEGHISGCSGGDSCLCLRNAPAAVAEADAACGLITSAPSCPTLSHTTTLVGTTQLQKFDAASTTSWTFPDEEGMGESEKEGGMGEGEGRGYGEGGGRGFGVG